MSDVRNMFTSYLIRAIKNTKINYVNKKKQESKQIRLVESVRMEVMLNTENQMEEKTVKQYGKMVSVMLLL